MYIHRGVLSYYKCRSIVVCGIAHGVAEKKNQEARLNVGRGQRESVMENQNSLCPF